MTKQSYFKQRKNNFQVHMTDESLYLYKVNTSINENNTHTQITWFVASRRHTHTTVIQDFYQHNSWKKITRPFCSIWHYFIIYLPINQTDLSTQQIKQIYSRNKFIYSIIRLIHPTIYTKFNFNLSFCFFFPPTLFSHVWSSQVFFCFLFGQ